MVFGSWIGYTAYIYLLEHVPTPKVATYAYVNPIVAVFLGWIILHEQVDVIYAAGDGDHHRISLAGEYVKAEAPAVDIPVSEETCPKTVNVAGD